MLHFRSKMHQIRFQLGLWPTPQWESSQRSPRLPGWIWGVLFLREGREEERGREREHVTCLFICTFFNKMIRPDSGVHYLIPEKRNESILSRLRNLSQYSIALACTERFKRSFVLYSLHSFPTDISEDFCDDFIAVSAICVFCFILNFT